MKVEISQGNIGSIIENYSLENRELHETLPIPWLYQLQSQNLILSCWGKLKSIRMQNDIEKRYVLSINRNLEFFANNSIISLFYFHNWQQSNKIKCLKDIHYQIWSIIAKDIPSWTLAKSIKASYFNSIDLSSFYSSLEKCKSFFTSDLQEILFNIVILSKDFPEIARAASNAVTILNKLRYSFNNKDLQAINAPYADFSHTNLINISLKNSDLRSANFSQSHLHKVNFAKCNLENAKFWPQKQVLSHRKIVKYFDISSCGKYLAAFGRDEEIVINVWELESDKLIKEIQCKEESRWLWLLRFSPCGNYISMIKSGILTLFEIWNDSEEIKFEGFYADALCFDFSPCKTYIAAGSKNNIIRVWDIKSKKLTHELSGHIKKVVKVSFSACSKFLYSISNDQYILIWNLNAKDTMISYYNKNNKLKYHKKKAKRLVKRIKYDKDDEIIALIPSNCRKFLILATSARILIWNINLGEKNFLYNWNNLEEVFYNMHNILVFKKDDGAIVTFDIETQNFVCTTFCRSIKFGRKLAILPGWKSIAVANEIKGISILDINDETCSMSTTKYNYTVNCISFSPCDNFLVTYSRDALIELWDLKSHKIIKQIEDSPYSAAKVIMYSPYGSCIVASMDNYINVYSPDLNFIQKFSDDSEIITAIAISPDEKYIMCWKNNYKITLWKINNLEKPIEKVCYLKTPKNQMIYFGFLNFKEMIVFYEHEKRIWMWSIEKKRFIDILQIKSDENFISQVCIWNNFLAYTLENPSNVFLYNYNSPTWEVVLPPLSDRKKSQDSKFQWQDFNTILNKGSSTYSLLKFSPLGTYFAALYKRWTDDKFINEIRIWQVKNKEFLTSIKENTYLITCFEFSPCENIIVAGISNSTLKFWDFKNINT